MNPEKSASRQAHKRELGAQSATVGQIWNGENKTPTDLTMKHFPNKVPSAHHPDLQFNTPLAVLFGL